MKRFQQALAADGQDAAAQKRRWAPKVREFVNQGKIIFLNGASSSGKSTIAKLLQDRLDEPFLHMQLDAFLQMLPHINDDLVMNMAPGFHQSVAAMAGAGNNVIVDHVLVADEWLEECVRILTGYVLFVGLRCPLTELERRESERDARRQGFARAQFEIVHQGKSYDVELDTSLLTPVECTQKVISFYSDQKPTAFLRMRQSLISGQPAGSGDALQGD